jgi:sugar phosphate isomerase/epimerase
LQIDDYGLMIADLRSLEISEQTMIDQALLSRRDILRAGAAAVVAGLAGAKISLAEEAAMHYQLGCYTRPWAQFEYRVALDGIAAAGFKYAGLMTAKTAQGKSGQVITMNSTPEEVAAVAEEVKKRGLKTLSIYGGNFGAEKSVENGIAGLKRLIDYSATCGCPNLLLGGTTNEKVFKDYYKVVAECCDYAAAKGVGLSVKPHGGQNSTGAQCRKIIESVGKPNFRIWYDAGNIYYYSKGALDPVQDAPAVDDDCLADGHAARFRDEVLEAVDQVKHVHVRHRPASGAVRRRRARARGRRHRARGRRAHECGCR